MAAVCIILESRVSYPLFVSYTLETGDISKISPDDHRRTVEAESPGDRNVLLVETIVDVLLFFSRSDFKRWTHVLGTSVCRRCS